MEDGTARESGDDASYIVDEPDVSSSCANEQSDGESSDNDDDTMVKKERKLIATLLRTKNTFFTT